MLLIILTTMGKGPIQEVKDKLLLVFELQRYCNKWMSDDYLFMVLKENYHYNGSKSNMKQAMSSLEVDYPNIYNVNPKSVQRKRITFYYVSPERIRPDTSKLSQSDWVSICEYKRVTRAPMNNKSTPAICEHHQLSQDAISKHCGNKGQDALQTYVPNFVKNYASLTKSSWR